MSAELAVREAAESDLQAVVRLWTELQEHHCRLDPEHFQPLCRESIELSFKGHLSSPYSTLFLASWGDRACGFVLVSLEDPIHPGFRPIRRGHVRELAVARAFRRRGIGTRLLDAATDWAKARGAAEMSLCVFEANRSAQDFYRKLGWIVEMRRMLKPMG